MNYFKKCIIILFSIVLIALVVLYSIQENLIFFPEKVDKNYEYEFPQNFEELNFNTADGNTINALLFKVPNPKGLVFFVHGNAASLKPIGFEAQTYTNLGYDVFMFDYPGFGKSTGRIKSQEQLFENNQMLYEEMKKLYNEVEITLLGYSIGTGMASKLASDNHPKQLILQAPYYSFTDLAKHKFSLLPTFILKYSFKTNEYLKQTNIPITIFHGKEDDIIYAGSSEKLKEELGDQVDLHLLDNQGHVGINENPDFQKEIKEIVK